MRESNTGNHSKMRREKSLERFLSTWKFTSAKAQRVLKHLLEEDEEDEEAEQ